MPEPSTSLKKCGNLSSNSGRVVTAKPQPIEMAMIKPLRLLRATLSNIWIPAAIIIANIIKPAPPNTGNGIDTINADQTGGTEFPVHDLFSEKRLMIGENWAYFDRIDFENPYIIAIPMKVVGCDGSPVRAIAVEWED